ncbi:hypothetical protein ACYSNW_01430 [Enterococcus sp. LJL99]
MDDKQILLEKATELTIMANQIDLTTMLLDNMEYSRVKGDYFPIHHQVGNGLLSVLSDQLTEMKISIEKISNDICPDIDEMESESNE